MTTTPTTPHVDVFDLAPHEQEHWTDDAPSVADPSVPTGSVAAEPAYAPWELNDFASEDPDKLPFLSWLWRHHVPGDEFYPLAHLVLTGGPGDLWLRKTVLIPSFVARDIAELYATGRVGVTEEHLDLANKAVLAYRESTDTIPELVARRRRNARQAGNPETGPHREIKDAQFAGFLDLGTVPVPLRAANSTATINEVVPQVDPDSENMPADFRTFKVKCMYQDRDSLGKHGKPLDLCGRPSVVGSVLCARHGGVSLAYTAEELKEIYNGARQRLLAATLMAVDATIELARSAVNETVRLKAAEVILDRTGFVPGVEIHLPGQTRDGQIDKTPAQIVLERLNQLGIAAPVTTPSSNGNGNGDASDESDVVEAEVVEERP
jgi:hypothetical protein